MDSGVPLGMGRRVVSRSIELKVLFTDGFRVCGRGMCQKMSAHVDRESSVRCVIPGRGMRL